MVLARRMNPGRRCSDWASEVRCAASASVVVARCSISPLRSELRVAAVVTRLPVLTMKLVNWPVLRFSSRNRALEEAIAGLR